MQVTRSDRLVAALRYVISLRRPPIVIETGTYLGLGSTRIFLEAYGDRPPERLYTIEISRSLCDQASRNLAEFSCVDVLWGLSVGREEALRFVLEDAMTFILPRLTGIKVDNTDPIRFYLSELTGAFGNCLLRENAPDRLLEPLLAEHRRRYPLIALDSCGGIGWLEFQLVHDRMKESAYCLFLDDVNHVKHYRSLRFIQSHSAYRVIALDMADGWVVATHTPGA